jgi:chemotaxis protein MotB
MVGETPDELVLRDRWLLSYADFITLLLAVFVVLYAVSSVNVAKYASLSKSLTEAFQRPSQQLVGNTNVEANAGETQPGLQQTEILTQEKQIEALLESLHRALEEIGGDQLVSVSAGEKWIDLVLDSSVLFGTATAAVDATHKTALNTLVDIIRDQNREIRVQGHTDNAPIATRDFPSNWELSAVRAASVVRFLAESGVDSSLLSAVGFGDTEPVASNSTEAGRRRNRRVVIQVSTEIAGPRPDAVAQSLDGTQALTDGEPANLSVNTGQDVDIQPQEETPVAENRDTAEPEDPFDKLDPALLRQLYQMEFGESQKRPGEVEPRSGSDVRIDQGVETIRKEGGGLLIKGKGQQRDD